jgi:hypothetical protein
MLYSKSPIGFDKQLPRDNKMFYINEGNNLNLKEETFLDRFSSLDLLPNKIKLTNLLPIDVSASLNALGTTEGVDKLLGLRQMTLEEKILSGYYKSNKE